MLKTKLNIIRNKFFFLLGLIILLSIFFIAFTNLQSHENVLLQQIEKLELQNDAMNKQAEVAKEEQNQRFMSERQLYEKTKKELNQKIRDEKEIHQKELHESQLRFNSLQQQFKILSTKYDDLEQQCTDSKKKLSTENDELKSKLGHVQAQYNKTIIAKDNDIAVWKVKHENAANEKEKLQKLLNTNTASDNKDDEHQQYLQLKYKNYQLEQEIKDLKQKLHITSNEPLHPPQHHSESHVEKSFQEQIPVSDDHYKIPINVNIKNKSTATNLVKANESHDDKNIINSVENFQILPQPLVESQNVLQQPVINGKTSTTTTTTPTPQLAKKSSTKSSKKLPKFVLPIPDIKNDESVHEDSKDTHKEENKKQQFDESLNKPPNDEVNENENGAHEINDNDFNIEEKNAHNHFDSLDQDRNMLNNAAEEFDGHKKALVNDEMDLEIINRPPNGGNVKDKLKDEIANDHGQEYPEEDLHIEQQDGDDLGDIGEYDDPKVLKNQGIAERN